MQIKIDDVTSGYSMETNHKGNNIRKTRDEAHRHVAMATIMASVY